MASKRSGQLGTAGPAVAHPAPKRRAAYLVAGVTAISAVGFGVVAVAPTSSAEAVTECTGGQGKISIVEQGGGYVGSVEVKDAQFKEGDDCPYKEAKATSGKITVTEESGSCVFEAALADGESGSVEAESGVAILTIPMNGKSGAVLATGKAKGDTSDEEAPFTITGKVKGAGEMDSCKLGPMEFTVTDVSVIEKR